MHVCSVTQRVQFFCNPMDCSPPGPSVHGISQARRLQCIAMPASGDISDPVFEPSSPAAPALAGGLFTIVLPGKPRKK